MSKKPPRTRDEMAALRAECERLIRIQDELLREHLVLARASNRIGTTPHYHRLQEHRRNLQAFHTKLKPRS